MTGGYPNRRVFRGSTLASGPNGWWSEVTLRWPSRSCFLQDLNNMRGLSLPTLGSHTSFASFEHS